MNTFTFKREQSDEEAIVISGQVEAPIALTLAYAFKQGTPIVVTAEQLQEAHKELEAVRKNRLIKKATERTAISAMIAWLEATLAMQFTSAKQYAAMRIEAAESFAKSRRGTIATCNSTLDKNIGQDKRDDTLHKKAVAQAQFRVWQAQRSAAITELNALITAEQEAEAAAKAAAKAKAEAEA